MTAGRTRLLGLLTLGFFAVHAGGYLWRGDPYGVLWCCTMANLVVGCGLILGVPRLNAIGVCWLFYGNGLWIADLLVSHELLPTSILTHWGGLFVRPVRGAASRLAAVDFRLGSARLDGFARRKSAGHAAGQETST